MNVYLYKGKKTHQCRKLDGKEKGSSQAFMSLKKTLCSNVG